MAIGFSGEPVPPGTLSGAPTNRKVQRFRLHPVLVLELYEQCCKLDLEGVVAKPKQSPYRRLNGKPLWVKVKNPDYSQAVGLTLEPGQRELRRRPALPIREPCRKFGRRPEWCRIDP